MSRRHINLYDSSLRRRREWLTVRHLAGLAGGLLVILLVWGAWLRSGAADLETRATALDGQLKSLQEQSLALGNALSGRRPDPRVEQELQQMRALLGSRTEILARLSAGKGTRSGGFAEYLQGLARQTLEGLWLTGFAVEAGGGGMEIRGRLLEPALLPEYIRRLNSEKAFQGRAFSALQVLVPAADPGSRAMAAPPYHEFSLVPVPAPGGEKPR